MAVQCRCAQTLVPGPAIYIIVGMWGAVLRVVVACRSGCQSRQEHAPTEARNEAWAREPTRQIVAIPSRNLGV